MIFVESCAYVSVRKLGLSDVTGDVEDVRRVRNRTTEDDVRAHQ